MTFILLEDISADISVDIDFQHKLMDSDNSKSTCQINAMHEELRYKQLKENVMQDVKKELDLSLQQKLSNVELHFYERIAQLESLVECTKNLKLTNFCGKLM